jgi:hypothetical protein
MRRAAAVDGNQRAIVQALRQVGASVEYLHRIGQGTPDLLVGFRRGTFLLEVKDPTKPASKRGLTADQEVWHRTWQGLPVAVVLTPEQALKAIGAIGSEDVGPAL